MLFSSPKFILLFLPIVFWIYFFLNSKTKNNISKLFLILASLFFYGYWNPRYLLILITSVIGNHLFSKLLDKDHSWSIKFFSRKIFLVLAIIFNLSLLAYFKYYDFCISTINALFSKNFDLLNILLPLGISFFTFQQIAYLVDIYRNELSSSDLLSYSLFIVFFPQLIAGPIVHFKEMMPQFTLDKNSNINWNNILLGLCIFSIGFFKKIVIADTLSISVDKAFANIQILGFWDAWTASLGYSFQLYFDFSGYADMAIGIALLFNIYLPINFNSPYKALNIQEFWQRWHMTLSRWLRDYIYFTLGGSRISQLITLRNLFLTAVVSGIWHGAGWTFIIWGSSHGLAMILHRLWLNVGFKMNKILAWIMTFIFINTSWIIFRANSIGDAWFIIKKLFSINEILYSSIETQKMIFLHTLIFCWFLICIVRFCPNSNQIIDSSSNPNIKKVLFCAFLFVIAFILSIASSSQVFLYFNF